MSVTIMEARPGTVLGAEFMELLDAGFALCLFLHDLDEATIERLRAKLEALGWDYAAPTHQSRAHKLSRFAPRMPGADCARDQTIYLYPPLGDEVPPPKFVELDTPF